MSASETSADHHSSIQGPSQNPGQRWESLYAILHELLQPESTLSLNEAVDRAVNFYNDDDSATTINAALINLADELSYSNPGHLKLAQFYVAFVDSGKWLAKSTHQDNIEGAKTILYDRMNISLYDRVPDISTDDPYHPLTEDTDVIEYVNAQAFRANLHALAYRGKHPLFHLANILRNAMDDCFKFDNSNEPPRVRDARIMGAAQWPKWAGPEIFLLAQRPGDPELEQHRTKLEQRRRDHCLVMEEASKTSAWFPFLERRKARKEEARWEKRQKSAQNKIKSRWPITWEQWQTWKEGFSAAAGNEMYSETSRKMAEEAADLMLLQEKGMYEVEVEKS